MPAPGDDPSGEGTGQPMRNKKGHKDNYEGNLNNWNSVRFTFKLGDFAEMLGENNFHALVSLRDEI